MGGARGLGLWICLALGLGLGALAVRTPAPVSATAPPTVFSAERAMADIRRIGAADHPIGSAAHDQVEAYLIARMTALGLAPQVHAGLGMEPLRRNPAVLAAGSVNNLLGVIPGRDRAAPALLVMAHYDSTANSPGAADDGAGVATALEIARLARAGPQPARDVMILLTDGEEAGLLGADAFFNTDPAAAHVGMVVNLEARGDTGRAAMFETGPRSAGVIALFGKAARRPFANSLATYLYHQLPNDTDFTHAVRHGLPGLNFSFIGDQLAYHTPLATPDHLSRSSLQHMGDEAGPAVLALAQAAWPPAATGPEPVYADLFGLAFVAYPPAGGWLVLVAGLILTLVAAGKVGREGGLSWRGVGQGAATTLAATLAGALPLYVIGRLLGGAGYMRGYHLYGRFYLILAGAGLVALGAALLIQAGAARGRGRPGLVITALIWAGLAAIGGFDPVAAGMAAALIGLGWIALSRPLAPWSGWIGALALGLVLTTLVQVLAPPAAFLFAWPLLAGAAGAAISALGAARRPALARAAGDLIAILALAYLSGLALALFTGIGAAMPAVLAAFTPLVWLVLAPALAREGERPLAPPLALALSLAGLFALAYAGLVPAGAARPDVTRAFFIADPGRGVYLRVAGGGAMDPWETATLALDGAGAKFAPVSAALGGPLIGDAPVWSASARPLAATPPAIMLRRSGARLDLTAVPAGHGRELRLLIKAAQGLGGVTVNGRASPLRAGPGDWAILAYEAPPASGVVLTLNARGPVQVIAAEVRDGWPVGRGPPPKPPNLMAFGPSDTTWVVARASAP